MFVANNHATLFYQPSATHCQLINTSRKWKYINESKKGTIYWHV